MVKRNKVFLLEDGQQGMPGVAAVGNFKAFHFLLIFLEGLIDERFAQIFQGRIIQGVP